MKKIKIAILGIVFVIVLLIILICCINPKVLKNENNNEEYIDDLGDEEEEYTYQTIPVKAYDIFYSVSYTIEKYFETIYTNKNFTEEENSQKKNILNNVLDKRFINDKGINDSNILDKLNQGNKQLKYTATEMNELNSERYQIYSVKGFLEIVDTNKYFKECYFIVILDSNNTTYSIYPLEENYRDLSEIELSLDNLESIEKNNNNEFIIVTIDQASFIKRYMMYYKNMALYHTEKAYELLDKEYREKRFNSLENFTKYINENKEKINNIILDKYRVRGYDEYTEYVAIDTQNNYYIFKESATMQFTLMLDTYTVDVPEFIEKYKKGNTKVKVGMNIEKVISALNQKDYKYVYNKLDESFRNNEFKNIENFESYIRKNLFNTNNAEFIEFSEEGEIYIYQLKIKELGNESENSKNLTVIMKLLEDTDFVMSFSIN